MKGIASHHIHRRKRGAKNLEPYPSRNRRIWLLDKAAVAAGILGPLMTLPQIWQIFYFHNAAGVSVLSWTAFGLLDIPFILYGLVHKDKLILTTYILWCTANLTVAVGAIIYH
jgi:uncharacterized protein with PQ loop repeat